METELTNLIVGAAGVLVGALGVWYARQTLVGPKLVLASNDAGDARSAEDIHTLIEVTVSGRTEILDFVNYGLIADLMPVWHEETQNAEPLTVSFFVANRGKKTARAARLFVPQRGSGYTIALEGATVPQAVPGESFFAATPKLHNLQCRELGDIAPGIKHPVSLTFCFGPRTALELVCRFNEVPVLFHDYYLSADDEPCRGRAIWLNLLLSPRDDASELGA